MGTTDLSSDDAYRRSDRLVVREVGDEAVVLDLTTSQTHVLNAVAASVLAAVDGRAGTAEIAERASVRLGEDVPVHVGEQVLADLAAAGLVSTGRGRSLDRRTAVRIGAAAVVGVAASPFLQSVILPSAASALSIGSGSGGSGGSGATTSTSTSTSTSTTTTTAAPTTTTTTAPAAPTQRLTNPDFTSATTGWSNPGGFQTASETVGSQPSVTSGVLQFSYNAPTNIVTQTVSIASMTGFNQIQAVARIANFNNFSDTSAMIDKYYFQVVLKNAGGSPLATLRNPASGYADAPGSYTSITLTQLRAGFAQFDNIRSATITIAGYDGRGWAGTYGPVVDFVQLNIT